MPIGLWPILQGVSPLDAMSEGHTHAGCPAMLPFGVVLTENPYLPFCVLVLQYSHPATWPSAQKLIRVGAWGGVAASAGLWMVQVSSGQLSLRLPRFLHRMSSQLGSPSAWLQPWDWLQENLGLKAAEK